jgi:hypothetical protein
MSGKHRRELFLLPKDHEIIVGFREIDVGEKTCGNDTQDKLDTARDGDEAFVGCRIPQVRAKHHLSPRFTRRVASLTMRQSMPCGVSLVYSRNMLVNSMESGS